MSEMMKALAQSQGIVQFQTKLKTIKVIKRDGRSVDFDDDKIYAALMKAEKKFMVKFVL